MTLEFQVIGVAQSMGSKRAFTPKGWRRPIITDSNRNLKSWQSLVADGASRAIQQQAAWAILDGPVRLTLAFYLPRPKSLAKRQVAHIKAPDCSKLIRSTEDALSGIVYRDDAQVVEIVAGKFYAGPSESPHVRVTVATTAGDRPAVVPAAPLPLFAEVC
jgi:crossover junction endodeoxyribonuclease RusA